jgi:hypothetical protein
MAAQSAPVHFVLVLIKEVLVIQQYGFDHSNHTRLADKTNTRSSSIAMKKTIAGYGQAKGSQDATGIAVTKTPTHFDDTAALCTE